MHNLPFFDAFGEKSRLFPVLSEKSKEGRTLSAFLSVFAQVKELSNEILGAVGNPVGTRATVSTFTEVSFPKSKQPKIRPDGLIVLQTGKRTWSALVEAKIGNDDLKADQIESYLSLAREVGIDAVITLSNQFTTTRDQSPVTVNGHLLRTVSLYHYSWFSILTYLSVLSGNDRVEDPDHNFLLEELERFLIHQSAGLKRFTQMTPSWTSVVDNVRSGLSLSKSGADERAVVESWQAEIRDLALYLTRKTGETVAEKVSKKVMNDPTAIFDRHLKSLVEERRLTVDFAIPNAAAPLSIEVDLTTRTIHFSAQLAAPKDKKRQASRLNWLLVQLPDDKEQTTKVRTLWPGRASPIETTVFEARSDDMLHSHPDRSLLPHKFVLIDQMTDGRKFGGRSTFINELESGAIGFYENVLSHLKAWTPPAPKIRKAIEEERDNELPEENTDQSTHHEDTSSNH